MQIVRQSRRFLRQQFYGPWDMGERFTLGLEDPQSEVTVWLDGLGARRDVTQNHLMACAAPFTIGIGFDPDESELAKKSRHLVLRFCENATQQTLGEIQLEFASSIHAGSRVLCLFRRASHRNYCLPRRYIWARDLKNALRGLSPNDKDVPITPRENRAMAVFYTCPRPVVLVSVIDGDMGNLFPMNIMGPIGNGYFAFGLNSSRSVAPLVERAKKVVLSNIPVELADTAFKVRGNHRKLSINWSELPFATITPRSVGIPVPEFASRIREMHVEGMQKIGSHILFVAKTTHEETLLYGPQFFLAHGSYHAWRQRQGLDPMLVA
ncbi:hypothetical protein H7849_00205 [Alloacidobacterium dinghuense]|uniref:Flavin reductase like domain-containing protein n=1 Tax=Alloacidobacterium dinghuense TaxID=2763107 RepID=A0A7G8BIX3_9BACT|nr:hypothetical protein [Alloacidobacterium dinghuense]QNI32493.1 hypothetical protein H7849_00205 [Alloacidobacterium dinghuense]